jgi:hypothetical protein
MIIKEMTKQIWLGAGKGKNARGLFLTLMLYFAFFGTFLNLAWNLFAGVLSPNVSASEFWSAAVMIILLVFSFVSIYGIWNLKKWGVLLNILLMLGLIVVEYLWSGKLSIINISIILMSPILLYIAVFRKWRLFI